MICLIFSLLSPQKSEMEIRLEKSNELTGFIKIRLEEADYRPQVDKKIKEYAKKVTMKGFRPGKVPVGLVTKMYGKSVLVDEVNNIAVNNLQTYIKEEKLNLIASPIFDPARSEGIDWENPTQIEFHYEVGLSPEIGDLALQNISLREYEVEVGEQELEDQISQLKEMFAEHEHPEEVGENDEIGGSLKQGSTDFEARGSFKISEVPAEKRHLFIGKASQTEVSFDINEVLSAEILKSRFRLSDEKIAELKGEVSFQILHIARKNPLASDQEFYDKVFGVGNIGSKEEFEEKVKNILAKKNAIEASELLISDFQKAVSESVNADLPEEFLRKWLQTQHRLAEADVERHFPDFKRSMRWEVVKGKLIENAKIEQYQPEELVEYLKKRFFLDFYQMGYFVTDDSMLFGAINHFLQSAQEDNQRLVAYENNMVTLKLFELFKDQMNVQKKTVSNKEFDQIMLDSERVF